METSILDKYNAGLIPSKTNATTAAIRQVNAQHSPLTKIKTGYDRELEQTPIDDYEEMYLLDKENPEETLKDKSYLKDAWTTFMNSRDQINLMSERAKLAKDINPVLDDIDYELNFLDAAIQKTPIVVVPICSETHNRNETSHFRPVVDLLGMYLKFWKYLFTSNVATVFDLVFFIIFESLFSKLGTISIFVATICARAISGSVGYILNRYISFHSKLNPGREMVRYSIVFVCQMAASGILVSLLSVIPIPTVIVKAIIDTILFFVVYNIQKNWVFTEK